MRAALLAVLALAACDPPISITALEPPYGPLHGGTRTTIRGEGFAAGPAPVVLIGGREAAAAIVVDDSQLTVLTPPAAAAGDVDVEITVGDHHARATGGFRYSTPPLLAGATPRDVLDEEGTTRVTVGGHGFLAEDAGAPNLLVDGEAVAVTIERDDALSFVAPGGWLFREPFVELVNNRGQTTLDRAFRYVPGRPGLLLFVDDINRIAVYVDPVDLMQIDLPRAQGSLAGITSVVRDAGGGYHGVFHAPTGTDQVAVLDLSEQVFAAAREPGRRLAHLERVAAGWVAYDVAARQIGRLDPTTLAFTPLPSVPPIADLGGLAFDGARLYAALHEPGVGDFIRTVDLDGGGLGAPVPIDRPVDDLRFFAGTLYALGNSQLWTLDRATGETALVPIVSIPAVSLSTFE